MTISPLRELLVNDSWANVSVSSLDLSDDSDDDCSDDCAVLSCLSPPRMTQSRRHNTTQQTLDRLQNMSGGGNQQKKKKKRSSHGNTSMRKTRSMAGGAGGLPPSHHSCSTNELPGFLGSPMLKFSSHISDSNLSASRSSLQAARVRSVSQANAKWDVSGLKIQRSTAPPSLAATMALGLTRLPKNTRATSAGARLSCRDSSVSINSTTTRWSTSTHTRDGEGSVRFPRRRTSRTELVGLDVSDDDLFDDGEEFDYDSQAPVVKGFSAKLAVAKKEWQNPVKAAPSAQEETSLKTLQEAATKTIATTKGFRPKLPQRQKSNEGRRSTPSSIDQVLQDAMIVANSISEEELGLGNETTASLAASAVGVPASSAPQDQRQRSDSLVSLIGPASAAACHSGQHSAAREQPNIGDLSHVNRKARTSMPDLALKVPQRRGSIAA